MKTFNQLLLISLIPVVFLSCNNTASQPQNTDAPAFKTGSQGACDNNLKTQNYTVRAASTCSELLSSKFENGNLTVVIKQTAFCNSIFKTTAEISGSKISLKADDTSTEASRCQCSIPLTYTFSGVKNTSYQVEYTGKVLNNEPCTTSSEIKSN